MGNIVSKFRIGYRSNGRPVINILDSSRYYEGSIIVIESDSLLKNIDQILSYVYDEHRAFVNGFALVRSGDLWGYINLKLEEVIVPEYTAAFPVCEGFALVKKEGKYYYFKMSQNIKWKWNIDGYEEASPFCSGRALVMRDGLYGFLSNTVKYEEYIPCQFEEAFDFDSDYPYAVIKTNGKYGMINKSGNTVVEPMFDTYYKRDIYDSKSDAYYNATIGDVYYKLKSDGTYSEVGR